MNLSAATRLGYLLTPLLFLILKGHAQYLSTQELISLHTSNVTEATEFFEPNGWDFIEKKSDQTISSTSYVWAHTLKKSTKVALAWFSYVYTDKKKVYSQYQMHDKGHYIAMLNEMKSLQFELIKTYIQNQILYTVYRNSFYTILVNKTINELSDNDLNCFRIYKNLIYMSLYEHSDSN